MTNFEVGDVVLPEVIDFDFVIVLLEYHEYDFYVEKEIICVSDNSMVIAHLIHTYLEHHCLLSIKSTDVSHHQK